MTERAVDFVGWEVRALLSGDKSAITRPVRPQPEWREGDDMTSAGWAWEQRARLGVRLNAWRDARDFSETLAHHVGPRVGDTLYVRESWYPAFRRTPTNSGCVYRVDDDGIRLNPGAIKTWRSSAVMPRWASRFRLRVTAIRCMRLHELMVGSATAAFGAAWNDRYGKRYPWASNPWCWRAEFERLPENGEGG